MAKRKTKTIISLTCLAVATICFGVFAYAYHMKQEAHPTAQGDTQPIAYEQSDSELEGWPLIDWAYWQDINPDICAWIKVPGTSVDYPVMQASLDAPEFYLKHDIHKDYNIWGVPYLDAENATRGILSSKAAWVYAHNMLDSSMFEPLVQYADPAFMAEHPKVWIQTPSGIKRSYDVYAAEVLRGTDPVKRTDFKDSVDFASWRDMRYVESCATRIEAARASRVLCLVTCSHYTFKNERTVVYCMPSVDARAAK